MKSTGGFKDSHSGIFGQLTIASRKQGFHGVAFFEFKEFKEHIC
jgi:hypothetical protein